MAKDSYGRSFFWCLAFFGFSVAAFVLMFAEVANWPNPIWGPQAKVERALAAEQARIEEELAANQAKQAELDVEEQKPQQSSQEENNTVDTGKENREAQPGAGEDAATHDGETVATDRERLQSELEKVRADKARIEAEQARMEEEKPRARAQAKEREKDIHSVYEKTTVILALIGAIPYLGLLLTLSDRIRITDRSLQQVRPFRRRRVTWDNLIECRDFLNYIHLVPTDRSSEIHIDYYQTFHRHSHLWRRITRKCRDAEANMMVGRRRGRVASCDLGLVPSLLFIVGAAATLVLSHQRIVLLGALSGIVLALSGARVWITTRLSPRRWRSGSYLYLTLFVLSLILPPAYFAQEIHRQGNVALARFGTLYLVGLMAGSGVISSLLPSRKRP